MSLHESFHECPLCGSTLTAGVPEGSPCRRVSVATSSPAVSAAELDGLNALLAEDGEPATCMEEVERWREWQTENVRRLA